MVTAVLAAQLGHHSNGTILQLGRIPPLGGARTPRLWHGSILSKRWSLHNFQGGSVFRGGDFDQLPRYPRSETLNQPTKQAAVVAETFSVSNTTPQQVLQYYADHLVGWTATEPVQSIGPDAYRGAWTKGTRELLVSGSRAPTLSQDQPVIQYSLELGPVRPVP